MELVRKKVSCKGLINGQNLKIMEEKVFLHGI